MPTHHLLVAPRVGERLRQIFEQPGPGDTLMPSMGLMRSHLTPTGGAGPVTSKRGSRAPLPRRAGAIQGSESQEDGGYASTTAGRDGESHEDLWGCARVLGAGRKLFLRRPRARRLLGIERTGCRQWGSAMETDASYGGVPGIAHSAPLERPFGPDSSSRSDRLEQCRSGAASVRGMGRVLL